MYSVEKGLNIMPYVCANMKRSAFSYQTWVQKSSDHKRSIVTKEC